MSRLPDSQLLLQGGSSKVSGRGSAITRLKRTLPAKILLSILFSSLIGFVLMPSLAIATIYDRSPADQDTQLVIDEGPGNSCDADECIPLVLIHGIHGTKDLAAGSREYWFNLRNYLYSSENGGQCVVPLSSSYKIYRFEYLSDKYSVWEIARSLRNKIDDLTDTATFSRTKPFVIVAHSMGGLVARSYMKQHQHYSPSATTFRNRLGGERVSALITLATPHHGSPMANDLGRDHLASLWMEGLMDIGDIAFWKDRPGNIFEPGQPNRSDLRWDNFDGSMTGTCYKLGVPISCYENNSSERNAWLIALNSDVNYDKKLIAYYGYIDPFDDSINSDHNRSYLVSQINPFLPTKTYDALLGYACGSINPITCINGGVVGPHQQLLVTSLLLSQGMNNIYLYNDGLVTQESGSFAGHSIGGTHGFDGYDHEDMKDDNRPVGNTNPLFDQLRNDLLDVSLPPSISIALPANSSTVGGSVPITTTGSSDVKRVEFYIGGILKFTRTAPPFNWTWSSLAYANGSHSLQVKAFDVAGNVGTSPPVMVTVDNSGGNGSPNLPGGLVQYKSDGSTAIGIGGSTDDRTVVMKGTVSDPNGDTVALDIEFKRIGTAFQNAPSSVCKSGSFVPSGSVAASTCTGLGDGHYRWQARARDSKGAVSPWQPAGGNAESADDFVVAAGGGTVNQPPNVTVMWPNGGESVVAGSQQTIRWSASDDVGVQSITIGYSTDGGLNYNVIGSGLPSSGSHAWTVPSISTSSALIQVAAFDGTLYSTDVGDGPFSIVQSCTLPGAPTLNDPGIYSETGNITINWDASNASSYVLEEATDLSFSSPNRYTVVGNSKYLAGKANGFYYYRLGGINACGQGPYSNVVDLEVRIPAPPAQATNPSPAKGQVNVQRQGLALSWSNGAGTSDVAIYFEKGNPDPGAHVGFGQVTGSSYVLPETLDAGATYYWKIRARASNGLITDSPVWNFNTAYSLPDLVIDNLSLTGTVAPNAQVTIDLTVRNQGSFASGECRTSFYYSLTSGAKEQLLVSQGTLIPALQPGEQAVVHQPVSLTNLKSGQSFIDALIVTGPYFAEGDVSNNMRSVAIQYTDSSGPNITWLKLGVDSFFKTGSTHFIAYAAKDDIGIQSLDFSYSPDNGSTWHYIVQGYVPTGSIEYPVGYPWTIPADCPLTTTLLIKLTAWDTSGNSSSRTAGPYEVKDGSAPGITVLSPNGGEVWDMGSTHDIRWTLSAPNGVGMADIWLYYDGHSDHIADIRANTSGVYSWTLRSNFSTKTARLRIDVRDMNGNSNADWSDGYFEVRDTSSPPPAPWNVPEVVDGSVMPMGTAVAVDASGGVHVAYSRLLDEMVGSVRRVTTTVYYRKHNGSVWSAPQVVFNVAQDIVSSPANYMAIRKVRILTDSSGLPHIVWGAEYDTFSHGNDNEIYYSHYNGSTWSTPRSLSDSITGPTSGAISVSPDMTLDSAGNLHVVWVDGTYWEADPASPIGYSLRGTSGISHSIQSANEQWTAPALVASPGRAPTIAGDGSGNTHLAYSVGLTTLDYRLWNGAVWSGPQTIAATTTASFWEPDLSVDGEGVARVVWRYWADAEGVSHVKYSERSSGTWSAPEDVTSGGPNFEPDRSSLVIDATGRPHIITEDNLGLPPALYHQYRGALGWSNRISLFLASQWPDNYTSSVAISPARDHIHVVSGSNKGLIYNHAVIPTTLDIIAPVVTITAPALGEVVANGASYQITWTVSDDSAIGTVKIECSSDGGNTYTVLAESAPNTGSYQWPVPSPEVAAAQLRITAVDPSGNAGLGISGAFSIKDIQPPQVSLLSPAGGENWDAGSQHDISWNATDNIGVASVALSYSADGGASWQSITSGLVGIGTYGWSVPYVYSTTVRVKAVAYDTEGLSSEAASPNLTIVRPNTPPVTPYGPLPIDNQTNVGLDVTIRWSSGDQDGDALTYTVFFGTVSNPPQVATGIAGTSYSPGPLVELTDYSWRIVASDGKASTAGTIWKFTSGARPINAPTALSAAVQSATQVNLNWNDTSGNEAGFSIERKIAPYGLYQVIASLGQNSTSFADTTTRGNTTYFYRVRAYNALTHSGYSPEASGTTMNTPPDQPSDPRPANLSSSQLLRATLRWVGDDADLGDRVTYDVYFGASTNAPLISERQEDRQLSLGTLDPNSVYYWRIVAFDSHGDSTAGPWWTFVTGDRSPVISLDPAQLTFEAARGSGITGSQELAIANTGGCVMQWVLGADAGWLKSNSVAGMADATVQITADTVGLASGSYQGNLTIFAEGADNAPQVVPVALTITDPVLSVTISPEPGGIVTAEGISCPGTCAASFPDGTPIAHLTATPAAGYYFLRWEGNASGSSALLDLPMNGNQHVAAIFARANVSVCLSGCDFTTIQAALDAAGTGDVIVVAPGTWKENLTVGGSKEFTLVGNGATPGATVLSGDTNPATVGGDGSVMSLLAESGVTINVSLKNLTMTTGLAPCGGGLGLVADGGSAQAHLDQVVVSQNQTNTGGSGGGICAKAASAGTVGLNLVNSMVVRNGASVGGGIYTLADGSGSNVNVNVLNATLGANSATSGGGFWAGSTAGGCVTSEVANSVVASNYAGTGGDLFVTESGGSTSVSASYTDIQVAAIQAGVYTRGAGMRADTPVFVSPARGSFSLNSDSGCIDTASASLAPGADCDGKARPKGAGPDMGALEYVPSTYAGLKLLTLTGGEVLPRGISYDITWGAPARLVKFKLYRSFDAGLTWSYLGASTKRHFSWKVPLVSRTNSKCRIKISGYNKSGVLISTVKSAKSFTIKR